MSALRLHEALCFDSMQKQLFFYDDFLGDQLQDEWGTGGGGSGTTAVVDGQTGGIIRLSTGIVDGNTRFINWSDIRSILITKNACLEVRASMNSITVSRIYYFLFYDWDNYLSISYASTDVPRWRSESRSGGTETKLNAGNPNADTSYHIHRVQCATDGGNHIHYYIDGTELPTSPHTTNLPTASYLQPRIQLEIVSGGVAKSADIDYVGVRQDI